MGWGGWGVGTASLGPEIVWVCSTGVTSSSGGSRRSGRVLGCLPLLSGPHSGSPGQSLVGTCHSCPGKTLSLPCWAEVALGPPRGQQCLMPGAVLGDVCLSQGAGSPVLRWGSAAEKQEGIRRRSGQRSPCTLQHVWG